MPRYAYVNGEYVPHNRAHVHIEDRGYQFADGVYEVIGCIQGRLADERGHLDRLERSLSELSIPMPVNRKTLEFIIRHLLRKNRLKNAAVYIQVTRGIAPRDFKFPEAVMPSLVLTSRPFDFESNLALHKGVEVVTVPDQRWARRDIKTIALLPQALAKQKAYEMNAYEAWMLDAKGMVTEGSSSNAWIYKGGKLITHESGVQILKGVTRTAIREIAKRENIDIVERSFSPKEAYDADEAFCSSATALLAPVVKIDGNTIGSGTTGALVQKIYNEYRAYVNGERGDQIEWTA